MECVRRPRGLLLLVSLAFAWLWQARPALAQEGAGPPILVPARSALAQGQIRASALAFDCIGDQVVFETLMHQRRVTTFNLPSPVLDVVSSDPRGLQLEWEGSRVILQPRRARDAVPATLRQVMEMLTDVRADLHALQKGGLRPPERQDSQEYQDPHCAACTRAMPPWPMMSPI